MESRIFDLSRPLTEKGHRTLEVKEAPGTKV
jgi:hypothetical protein